MFFLPTSKNNCFDNCGVCSKQWTENRRLKKLFIAMLIWVVWITMIKKKIKVEGTQRSVAIAIHSGLFICLFVANNTSKSMGLNASAETYSTPGAVEGMGTFGWAPSWLPKGQSVKSEQKSSLSCLGRTRQGKGSCPLHDKKTKHSSFQRRKKERTCAKSMVRRTPAPKGKIRRGGSAKLPRKPQKS